MPEEAPALVDILGPLVEITALCVAIASIALLRGAISGLLNALAGISSWIPFGGSITSSVIHSAEHAISNGLGNAISGLESRVGHEWHNFAHYMHTLWEYQVGVAENLFHLAQRINRLVTTGDVTGLWHRFTRLFHQQVIHLTRTIVRDFHKTIKVTHAVAQGVYPRLRAAEHAIDVTIPREFGHLRKRVHADEGSIKRLWDRVKGIEARISDVGLAAIVAAALAAIGLDWLGCRDGASRVGRSGCGLWDDLGDVFGLLAAAALAVEFEQFVHDAQAATEATVAAVKDVSGLG